MRILIATTIIPFIEGGGTFIADWLKKKLKDFGHEVEILKIPFEPYYETIIEQMLAIRLINIKFNVDKLITIRTPSYLIKHPNKVIWFIHHHREAYDYWNTKYCTIPKNSYGLAIRNSIIKADNLAFSEAKKIFTNSKIVADRLLTFNKINAEVLYPPLLNPENFYCNNFEDYVFYPSRINLHKRQSLLIEALKYTKTNVKVIIAGQPDTKENFLYIKSIIQDKKIKNKLKIIDRWISEKEKIELMSNSLAVAYIPYMEDSYGYVTLEAFYSKKPIITCIDSGGTLEIIQDKYNGFIVEPNPKKIAQIMDYLFLNKKIAKETGEGGIKTIKKLNINWKNVILKLTS